jgi:hypothetical protein
MKTFDFIQVMVSHNLKDPHSKSLEPDCLSPLREKEKVGLKGPRGITEKLMKQPVGPSP